MFYEIYIDIFFAVNAVLDFLIILIVQKIQHYRSTMIRMIAAAMAGSAILSVYLCIPVKQYMWTRLLFYMCAYVSMAVIAFPGNKKAGIVRAVILLYLVSFLVNGIFRWLNLQVEHVWLLFVLCVGIYVGIRGAVFLYARKQEETQHIYEIRINYKQHLLCLKGLWDTGNLLRSPYHQKGVSVISYEAIRDYLSDSLRQCVESGDFTSMEMGVEGERIFLIPYETIDAKPGIMPVLAADRMLIQKEGEELEYENPLLGISSKPVSIRRAFQVVLTAQG
ncbi:MAG: sigma-E processing peptidase SpoIIGA [Lachnospiraceae bacterium]|nr:sigma-E processing peptidase SpoIIGA [Lachnospiraceae bacterium]